MSDDGHELSPQNEFQYKIQNFFRFDENLSRFPRFGKKLTLKFLTKLT